MPLPKAILVALVAPMLIAAEPPVSRLRAAAPPERTDKAAVESLSAAVMVTVPAVLRLKRNCPSVALLSVSELASVKLPFSVSPAKVGVAPLWMF